MIRALVLVAVLAAPAAADVTIATSGQDTITIARIAKDRVKVIYTGKIGVAARYAFSNEHTLWVLAEGTVTRFVDGKPAKVGAFAARDLVVTTSGQVWLQLMTGYVRIDGDPQVTSKTAPVDVLDEDAPPPAALAGPPKGYAAHLRDHEGNWGTMQAVTCTAPGGKGGVWSSALRTATGFSWVMDSPVMLAIDAHDPMAAAMLGRIGSSDDLGLDLGSDGSAGSATAPAPAPPAVPHPHRAAAYMEACTAIYDEVHVLPDGLWAGRKDDIIRIKRGSKLLGTIRGYGVTIAP